MNNNNTSAQDTVLKTTHGTGALPKTPIVRSAKKLPPINNGETSNSGIQTPARRSPVDKSWSRYHSGCGKNLSIFMDWMSVKTEPKSPGKITQCIKGRSLTSLRDIKDHEVTDYLDNNRQFLERYITERIPTDILKKWLANKVKLNHLASSPYLSKLNRKSYVHGEGEKEKESEKQNFMAFLKVLKDEPTELTVMKHLANYMSTSVGVDAYMVYKLYPDHPTYVQNIGVDFKEDSQDFLRFKPEHARLILKVAKNGHCSRLSRNDDPKNFPETPSSLSNILKKNIANHVMYQPILTKNGKTAYVVEMWRIHNPFEEIDEKIISKFLVLGSLSLHCCNMYLDKKRERNMSDFLLEVVNDLTRRVMDPYTNMMSPRTATGEPLYHNPPENETREIFEEMVSLDQLIKKILKFAQRIVNADRASLFLVDYRNFELVSTVFDLKFESFGNDRDMEKKEIRMPINRGIAGHVALSGETMNIPDAYSDFRFNREVDEATGYKTVNILCMPIKVEGRVIGVVQMVNKRDNSHFAHEDEAAFETCSTFFGLALHHARLYDRIMRKEQKYRVALEVLSYHNTCREKEVIKMLSDKLPLSINLNNYYLDPFKFDEYEKCKTAIDMFIDLFGLTNFDLSTLTRFVLTVKKNYRTVPYHNFDHGWTVAHTMYIILKNDNLKRFNYNMRLALFVACLCHDLDHRGYTNKYMSEIASPLAAMYTTSTLEHHHFNITVTILQQDGHNIFSHISSEDYKEILGFIRHCILATDLAKFFPNHEKLNQLHADNPPKFDWTVTSHRDLALAISMTAADLSASAKPWEIQIKTAKVIFEEFYDQGDKERAAGLVPIPMMDRNKPEEQPASQVGFLSQICIPCYKILHKILPNTKPMYVMTSKNLERWKSIAEKIQEKRNKSDVTPDKGEEELKDGKAEIKDEVTKKSSLVAGSVSWEDEAEDEMVMKAGIWKNIDGVTWMDEEGIVINKKAFRSMHNEE